MYVFNNNNVYLDHTLRRRRMLIETLSPMFGRHARDRRRTAVEIR